METNKLSKVPSILLVVIGVLMLLFGLYFNIDCLGRLFKPPLLLYAANLLPGFVLIGTAFIINKVRRFRLPLITILIVLVPILFVGMFLVNAAIGFELSAKPETDPADYQDILEVLEYGQWNWLKHFPPSIPDNASNVSLYWAKGFLQSSMFLQLRFVLLSAEIKSLLHESLAKAATALATTKSSSSELPPHMALSAGEVEPLVDWPEDFEIIVFNYGKAGNADDEGYGTKEYWNKRFSYGVAISTKRNEIIYWGEEYPW